MSEVLDLETLFDLEEETPVEPKKTVREKRNKETQESRPASPPSEETTGERESIEEKQPTIGKADKRGKTSGTEPVTTIPEGWHANIIGKPKGRPNPYFQGVVASDGADGRQIFVPFKDIKFLQRQVYVDDITLENPTVLAEIYRIQGPFPDVTARITESMFHDIQQHPEVKLKKVYYSWVSDHVKPRRNYLVDHDERPTEVELKKLNKHMDEVEWALKPYGEKEELKKKDSKYLMMPKEEDIPPPVEDEEPIALDDEESEMEQPEE